MRFFLTPETRLGQAVTVLRTAFLDAGLDTPDLDARFLALHALGLGDAEFYAARDRPLGDSCSALAEAMRRRLAREPVARILGVWEFWSLPFELNAATLVPRPDTETIVEAALKELDRAGRRDECLWILDIGTGSGAILIALLSELPRAFGVGVDCSLQAVEMARRNARRNGVFDRAAFVVGNWAEAVGGRFDVVVSNPPYIPSELIRREPLLPPAGEGGPAKPGRMRALDVRTAASERLSAPVLQPSRNDRDLPKEPSSVRLRRPPSPASGRRGADLSIPAFTDEQPLLALDPEVLNHEPLLALDGGADGLDAYRIIAKNLPSLLDPAGVVVLELGIGQAAGVGALLRDAGFADLQIRYDLAGIERALIVRRP